MEPREVINHTTFTLGNGSVVLAHGFSEGMPCLWFSEALTPGKVGESAEHEPLNGGVCIRFETMDAILAHMDRVKRMVEALQEEVERADA